MFGYPTGTFGINCGGGTPTAYTSPCGASAPATPQRVRTRRACWTPASRDGGRLSSTCRTSSRSSPTQPLSVTLRARLGGRVAERRRGDPDHPRTRRVTSTPVGVPRRAGRRGASVRAQLRPARSWLAAGRPEPASSWTSRRRRAARRRRRRPAAAVPAHPRRARTATPTTRSGSRRSTWPTSSPSCTVRPVALSASSARHRRRPASRDPETRCSRRRSSSTPAASASRVLPYAAAIDVRARRALQGHRRRRAGRSKEDGAAPALQAGRDRSLAVDALESATSLTNQRATTS